MSAALAADPRQRSKPEGPKPPLGGFGLRERDPKGDAKSASNNDKWRPEKPKAAFLRQNDNGSSLPKFRKLRVLRKIAPIELTDFRR
jgi:hypothetical protein